MQYTNMELLGYLYIYSILGWLFETLVVAVREKRFCNRGFFNLPICLSYGIIFVLLIVIFPTMEDRYIFQFLFSAVIVSVVEFLAGELAKSMCHKSLWHYERNNLFAIEKKGLLFTISVTAIIFTSMYLIQPVIFMVMHIIPQKIISLVCIIFSVFLIVDLLIILYAMRYKKHEYKKDMEKAKVAIGNSIYRAIWKRLETAYPNMEQTEERNKKEYAFAKGLCLDKLVWIFLICALGGDIVETIFCRVTARKWMSRSSVIYGTFSIVWGLGATLLTVVLHKISEKEDRYVFIAGCVLGGVYEYVCSVFTEVFFGTVFWDYSHMRFNIGGRINLLYCLFWGIVAVVWMKIIYPKISLVIEKIPPIKGKIITWIVIILFMCDIIISAIAMSRYVDRKNGNEAENIIEEFADYHYDDNLIEKIWPNMKIR